MKMLRRIIQELILESDCAGASAKIQQGLNIIEERDLVVVVELAPVIKDGFDVLIQNAVGDTLAMYEVSGSRLCPTYVTAWTEVIDKSLRGTGVGAVLYDVAIEKATQLDNYLACDRGTVSPEAKRMWNYYISSPDYEAFQMDDRRGSFTPDKSDDAKQMTFHRDVGIPPKADPESYRDLFMSSPFTKGFRKKIITTIPCLGERYKEESM